MRIALVAPVAEAVPPRAYGGTERVVALLADGMVARGHEVTLFATGDSETAAQLIALEPVGIRGTVPGHQHHIWEMRQVLAAMAQAERFDVMHCHLGVTGIAASTMARCPTLHTLHGAIFQETFALFRMLKNTGFVSISDNQRLALPELNYLSTVYHGLPWENYLFSAHKDDYLMHLGRICPEKGTHLAIQAARLAGERLIIAAKVDPVDQAYYDEQVAPLIDGDQVQFVGEVGHADKVRLLSRAKAVLFPITWEEPFGLVVVEAMGCGTPVIAFRRGSVPELVVNGVTGWIVDDVTGMTEAIQRISRLSPDACREHVETHFSVERMLDGYETLYHQLAGLLEAA